MQISKHALRRQDTADFVTFVGPRFSYLQHCCCYFLVAACSKYSPGRFVSLLHTNLIIRPVCVVDSDSWEHVGRPPMRPVQRGTLRSVACCNVNQRAHGVCTICDRPSYCTESESRHFVR